jgi:hypothetical protein
LTGAADLTAAIDPNSDQALIVERRVRPIDVYPLRFTELWERIKEAVPGVKQSEVHQIIAECGLKGDPKYSAYNWRNKTEESRGPQPATPKIYNVDAVHFLVRELKRRYESNKPPIEAS